MTPTELALLRRAADARIATNPQTRAVNRRGIFHFDPHLQKMSTIDAVAGVLTVSTKGATEAVLPCC